MSKPFRCWRCGGVTARMSHSRLLTKFKCMECATYWWMLLGALPAWKEGTVKRLSWDQKFAIIVGAVGVGLLGLPVLTTIGLSMLWTCAVFTWGWHE